MEHKEFRAWRERMNRHFQNWREQIRPVMANFMQGDHPNAFLKNISENLLLNYQGMRLLDAYEPYQQLMEIWENTIQDDCWHISQKRWKPEITAIISVTKTGKNKGQKKETGWECDLVPKGLVISRFFADEQNKLNELRTNLENTEIELAGMEEEDLISNDPLLPLKTGKNDDDPEAGKIKIDKTAVKNQIKEWKKRKDMAEELAFLLKWLALSDKQEKLKKEIKEKDKALDAALRERINALTEEEVKTLVIDDKWLAQLEKAVSEVVDGIGHRLVNDVHALGERYVTPLPKLEATVRELEAKVEAHLQRMGFQWQ